MLLQIITHTPLYVWAILGLLVWRGLAASRAREVSVRALCILPLLMIGLGLQGILSGFGADRAAPLLWAAGLAAGVALGWASAARTRFVPDPARGVVHQPGSWLPLALMMAIFCMKYAVAVALAIVPALRQQAPFVAVVCVLFGALGGVFTGRVLRAVVAYRQLATH
jgi:hypothetical protein